MYKLVGLSKSSKVKIWHGRVISNADFTATIEIIHGYEDGLKQTDRRDVITGKNIGKSNETTPFEQASLELDSLARKKKDEGYVDENDFEMLNSTPDNFLPMLAKTWEDANHNAKFPGYIQPKLDGMRLVSQKKNGVVRMWSRKGKEVTTLSKIKSKLELILGEGESVDGEIYHHGWGFQRIISAVKKKNKDTDLLEYHIYDIPDTRNDFKTRFVLKNKESYVYPLKLVDTKLVSNMNELSSEEELAIKSGYEGIMFRNIFGKYIYKHRSSDLLKIKRFEDSEFKIIGGKEGQGRELGLVIFKCLTKDGLDFDVRPSGTVEERSEMWSNISKYIGQNLTVKHQGFTDDGRPRFPVGISVRPTWDM